MQNNRKRKKIKVKIVKISKRKPNKVSIHIAISPLKNPSRFERFAQEERT